MTEQERVEKLKARMSRWQAYVDKPQTNTAQQTAPPTDLPVETGPVRTARPAGRPQPRLQAEPSREATYGRGAEWADSSAPNPLTDLQEARIADLQTAIAREREQSDRLADEVRRAQTLHAVTLYSQLADENVRTVEHHPAQRQIPEAHPLDFEEARRKNLVRVFSLLLVLTSALVLAFFVTR